MSEANIELLKPVYEQWGQGNFRPVHDVYGPDIEWGWSEEWPDLAGVGTGSEGPSETMVSFLSTWEDWRCEAQEYLATGDMVLVLTRYIGVGKGSGFEVDTPGAHLWTMRDGRATRLVVFSDRERAREAAGLSG